MKVGEKVLLDGGYGQFKHEPNTAREVVLIGGGIGTKRSFLYPYQVTVCFCLIFCTSCANLCACFVFMFFLLFFLVFLCVCVLIVRRLRGGVYKVVIVTTDRIIFFSFPGITPLIAILLDVVRAEPNVRVTFLYSASEVRNRNHHFKCDEREGRVSMLFCPKQNTT